MYSKGQRHKMHNKDDYNNISGKIMSLVDSLHISYILAIKIVIKLASFDIIIIASNWGFIVLNILVRTCYLESIVYDRLLHYDRRCCRTQYIITKSLATSKTE